MQPKKRLEESKSPVIPFKGEITTTSTQFEKDYNYNLVPDFMMHHLLVVNLIEF